MEMEGQKLAQWKARVRRERCAKAMSVEMESSLRWNEAGFLLEAQPRWMCSIGSDEQLPRNATIM